MQFTREFLETLARERDREVIFNVRVRFWYDADYDRFELRLEPELKCEVVTKDDADTRIDRAILRDLLPEDTDVDAFISAVKSIPDNTQLLPDKIHNIMPTPLGPRWKPGEHVM